MEDDTPSSPSILRRPADSSRVRVALRIRPSTDRLTCLDFDEDEKSVTVKSVVDDAEPLQCPSTPGGGPHNGMTPKSKRPRQAQAPKGSRFFFDAVHGPNSTQADMYENAKDLVAAAKAGINSCVLAYGATGSGKTFTLHGTPSAPGIVPLAMDALFSDDAIDAAPMLCKLTAVELYNDKIIDLLVPLKKNPLPCDVEAARKAAAEIRMLHDGTLYGSDTFRLPVRSRSEVDARTRRGAHSLAGPEPDPGTGAGPEPEPQPEPEPDPSPGRGTAPARTGGSLGREHHGQR